MNIGFLKRILSGLAFAFIAFGLSHPTVPSFLVATSPDLFGLFYELIDLSILCESDESVDCPGGFPI